MTSYNPKQVNEGVLWPCHSIIMQFYVHDCKYIDVFCYNRSSDLGLGLPFNIGSTALLLMIVAKLTNLEPRYLCLSLGDAHIYSQHERPLQEQVRRWPYAFPSVKFPDVHDLKSVEALTYEDFKVEGYNSYNKVNMEMVS